MKSLQLKMQVAEARGHIAPGTAYLAAAALVIEAGVTAFYQSFYGQGEWGKAVETARQKEHAAQERIGVLREALLSDIGSLRRAEKQTRTKETTTTSDLPAVLSIARDRVLRQSFTPVDSPIIDLATRRIAQDFRPLHGLRFDALGQELPIRPEGEDVHYAKIDATEDGYRIANYELAFAYTWEMAKNDDISTLQAQMSEMGRVARQTRARVLYAAMLTLPRTVIGGSAGGPTVARIDAVKTALATLGDAEKANLGYMLDGIIVPAKWDGLAKVALNSEKLGVTDGSPDGNPVYQAAKLTVDPAMAARLGEDWLAIDSRQPWLEYAVLSGFEGGPRTYTKLPDVKEFEEDGSFDNHSLAIKVGDAVGAKVTNVKAVIRVKGN